MTCERGVPVRCRSLCDHATRRPKKKPPASSSPSKKTVVDVVHEFSMPSTPGTSRASRGRVNSRVTPACRQHESPRHRTQTCHGCNVRNARRRFASAASLGRHFHRWPKQLAAQLAERAASLATRLPQTRHDARHRQRAASPTRRLANVPPRQRANAPRHTARTQPDSRPWQSRWPARGKPRGAPVKTGG